MHIPPTNKKVKLKQNDIYRIDDSKVIERRLASDNLVGSNNAVLFHQRVEDDLKSGRSDFSLLLFSI